MNSGYLKVMILMELSKHPCSGYSLILDLSKYLGKKPSSGSVYPLLKNLTVIGLITPEEKGRSKVYHITPTGKKEMKRILSEKEDLVINNLKLLNEFHDSAGFCKRIEKNIDRELLAKKMKDWLHLRNIAIELMLDSSYETKKKSIRKVLQSTVKELEEIRDAR